MPDTKMSYDELVEEINRARRLLSQLELAAQEEEERQKHLMIDNLEAVIEDTEHKGANVKEFSKLAASELKALIEKLHKKLHD
ncbi:hypothetical protein G5S52_00380 [Grimontia sp. S25]|uniref:Uncharacterized protein n=1 Tax=Grimontia sedimenti TaxID=2711294 RepID=A0A6M1R7Q0_9GAMM|nr:hypothetical protein [Grimontia sedimenti]NGN96160.1 hypothetical protein [Grimontia sedimenti]